MKTTHLSSIISMICVYSLIRVVVYYLFRRQEKKCVVKITGLVVVREGVQWNNFYHICAPPKNVILNKAVCEL